MGKKINIEFSLLKQLFNLRCNRKPPRFCRKIEVKTKKSQISYTDSPGSIPSIEREECGISSSHAAFIGSWWRKHKTGRNSWELQTMEEPYNLLV